MLFIVLLTALFLFGAQISFAQWTILETNSSEQLLARIDDQLIHERRLVSVEPVVGASRESSENDDDVGFLAIFKPLQPGDGWEIRLNMTSDRFAVEQAIQLRRGYVITSVCGYEVHGDARFVAVWEKMAIIRAHEVAIDLTSDQYELKLWEYLQLRLSPVYVCGYNINGKEYYAGVWHRPIGYLVHWYIAQEELDDCLDLDRQYARENYHPIVFQVFNSNSKAKCTAIWLKDYGNSYRIQIGVDPRAMAVEQNDSELQPRQLTSFQKDGKTKYLILWTGQAFAWNGRAIAVSQLLPHPATNLEHIDTVITGFMRAHEIPAFSFAISVKERLVIARSYGLADIRKREVVNPDSRFRIASVTKPLTAVAIFKLIEMGLLKSLDEKVFGAGSGVLGEKFGTAPLNPRLLLVTVRHLLTHTAGGWSNQLKAEFKYPTLDRDRILSWIISTYQLQFLPGTVHIYSNIGYMFLGRIIETLSNQTYEAFVKKHILMPSGITGASVGRRRREQKLPNEVTYYSDDNANPYFNWDPTRMDSAAGWVMSPIELLRFMVRMDQLPLKADLLSVKSLNEMLTPSQLRLNYANGWQIKGWRSYFHMGSLAGSEAMVAQESDGTAIAACVNKRGAKENQYTPAISAIMTILAQTIPPTIPTTDLFDIDASTPLNNKIDTRLVS